MDVLFPVLMIAGPVLIGTGLWLKQDCDRDLHDAVAATIEVTGSLREQGDNGEVYRPVFRVANGPHAGSIFTSRYAVSPPVHKVGDVVDGFVSPATGTITTVPMRRRSHLFAAIFLALGAGAFLIGLFGWALSAFMEQANTAILPTGIPEQFGEHP